MTEASKKFDVTRLEWTRPPKTFSIAEGRISIAAEPCTDLWHEKE